MHFFKCLVLLCSLLSLISTIMVKYEFCTNCTSKCCGSFDNFPSVCITDTESVKLCNSEEFSKVVLQTISYPVFSPCDCETGCCLKVDMSGSKGLSSCETNDVCSCLPRSTSCNELMTALGGSVKNNGNAMSGSNLGCSSNSFNDLKMYFAIEFDYQKPSTIGKDFEVDCIKFYHVNLKFYRGIIIGGSLLAGISFILFIILLFKKCRRNKVKVAIF